MKWSSNSETNEDLEQLLRDCDLEKKIHSNSSTMSGGQKRKLQLAIGLLGGSKSVSLLRFCPRILLTYDILYQSFSLMNAPLASIRSADGLSGRH